MREGEERLNSGKDVPTFIPRTYLWSRRSVSPPKPLSEGTAGNFRPPTVQGVGDEIAKEWRQLESSWQQGTSSNRERAEPTERELLDMRYLVELVRFLSEFKL